MLACRGSVAGSIFTTGPIIMKWMSGTKPGDTGQQFDVHAFVDRRPQKTKRAGEESKPDPAVPALSAGLREVGVIDAAGEHVQVIVTANFCLVQA